MMYEKLLEAVEKLPKEAVEKASKDVTRKGYDTTGYQYQFLVNVLNDIVGMENWTFDYETIKELTGTWKNGKSFWEITVKVTIEIFIEGKTITRKCAGGHKSEMYSDALKGAITNGFKKTVSLFGVGKKAYEGTLDEDYRAPYNGQNGKKTVKFGPQGQRARKQGEKGKDEQQGTRGKGLSDTPPKPDFVSKSGKEMSKEAYIKGIYEFAKANDIDLSKVISEFGDIEPEDMLVPMLKDFWKAVKKLKK